MDCNFHVEGLVHSATFEAEVEIMLLPTILPTIVKPYPLGGVSVVMDNALFHHQVGLGDVFHEHGVKFTHVLCTRTVLSLTP